MNIEVAKRMVEEASFYMERIYSESAAKEALEGARFVYEYAEKLLRSLDEKTAK